MFKFSSSNRKFNNITSLNDKSLVPYDSGVPIIKELKNNSGPNSPDAADK